MAEKTIELIIAGTKQVRANEFFEYAGDNKFFAICGKDIYKRDLPSQRYILLKKEFSQDEYEFVRDANKTYKP